MKTILLKFAGPLQSWGTNSHFETRYTDFYPSKSAVIGLLAASLGYRRDESEKIQRLNEIKFAIRVDQKGNLLRDYHIAQKFKGVNLERNYVTNRYYLEDAIFVVGIMAGDEVIIELENALRKPYFQQFLGRRSAPVQADFIIKTTDEDLIKSLEVLPWQASQWYKKENRNKRLIDLEIYADGDLLQGETINFRRDKVSSFSQKNREFSYRPEKRKTIKISNDMFEDFYEEFDAFGGIGGSDVSI
ncbi:MAG: type I-E CRISPR-associated protein Cas5/CasD [Tissierellia bacterium]|nr:type I-E CRISPR-associated protein Cas5/CasD [Tissierellia bacterium]